jgi:hypothetical protein
VAGFRTYFRFHGELNDFLSPERREMAFECLAGATDTLKHVIESLGVPHAEVGRVTVNGLERILTERLGAGDSAEVFPPGVPIVLRSNRFVADGHVGRLAAYLRMLGFDTWYENNADDALLAAVASGEGRVLLTRDVGLLKRREVELGYCLRSDKPHEQLREVTRRFELHPHFAPFTRCMACNGPLMAVPKSEVSDVLPPHTRETKNEFSRCLQCGKIYWRGSHHAHMMGWIEDLAPGTEPPVRMS